MLTVSPNLHLDFLQVIYHIVNTLLQTTLLLIVGYLTLFFSEENFTDRIMVTLTVLLVMATLMGIIQAARFLVIPL